MIIRAKRKANFTVVNNAVYENNHLSWRAMGMLSYLLSKPDNWSVHPKALHAATKNTAHEIGINAVYDTLKELKAIGYVVMTRKSDGAVTYEVFDEPQEQKPVHDIHEEACLKNEPVHGMPDEAMPDEAMPDEAIHEAIIRTDSSTRTDSKKEPTLNNCAASKISEKNSESATPETPLQNATHSAPTACSAFVFDDMQDGTVSGEYIPAKPKSSKTSQNRTQGDKEAKGYGKTSKVWQAYSEAFSAAYGAYPKGNARVNGMLSQMVDRLGENDAVSVAAFYPTHPARWYAEKMHGVGPMLADCEKLYAELQTGRVVTSKSAQQRDRGASNMAALQEAMRQYDADMARKAA